MELRALISNPNGHSTSPVNAVDTQLPWYTKDLMVEETSSPTSSPLLSLGPSPCDSTASSPLESPYNNPYARHAPAAAQPIFSLPRPRVSSALAQQKRKRSISDSLVPTASKKRPAEDDDEDEVDVEDFIAERYLPSDSAQMSHHDQPSPRNDNDDESDGFVESGEEGDDGQADLEPGDASPRRRRLQGHESGPPSPPAFYQHGMNENPDGTAYYHCKFCQNTWPQSHFRNAQQFGAHCSNCARRQVRRPSLPGKLGSPTSLSMGHLPRTSQYSAAAGGDGFFPPRTSSSAVFMNGSGPKRALSRSQSIPLPLGRMKPENRGVFLWFDALPTDLIMRIFSFLQSSPRDLGAISSTCHFFSIIAAHDAIWRRMFETRWGTDLASRHVGTWKERFASRVAFLRAKASLPPSEPAAAGPEPVAEEEASRLKEMWNGLLVDPKLKTRVVERVHSVSRVGPTPTPSTTTAATLTTAQQPQPPQDGVDSSSGDTQGSATTPTTVMYLVQWASADESDASAPEERQRWVTDEIMTAAPVIALPGCSSAVRKRRASDGAGLPLKRLRRSLDDLSSSSRKRRSLEDDSDDGASSDNDDDGMDGDDEDDNDEDDLSLLVGGGEDSNSSSLDLTDPQQQHLLLSQRHLHLQQPQAAPQRKFEEGPQAKEARQRRQQLLREKEERARKRRRKGSGRAAAAAEEANNNNSNNNNDDVPLTKEDKERQQRDFLRVLYNNRDYKPVILFFDRNA